MALTLGDVPRLIAAQPGIDVVLERDEGCARFELPQDRMGDLVVVSGGPERTAR